MGLLETILTQMTSLSKPQKNFHHITETSISSCYGKVNYSNLVDLMALMKKTFRLGLTSPYDFININRLGNQKVNCKREYVNGGYVGL